MAEGKSNEALHVCDAIYMSKITSLCALQLGTVQTLPIGSLYIEKVQAAVIAWTKNLESRIEWNSIGTIGSQVLLRIPRERHDASTKIVSEQAEVTLNLSLPAQGKLLLAPCHDIILSDRPVKMSQTINVNSLINFRVVVGCH